MKRLLFISAVIVSVMLASGCIGTASGPPPQAELAVLDQEMTREASGTVVVHVTVKNISRAVAELAEVTVSFYDAGKNLIDSSRDSVFNLGPDETWDFIIECGSARCGDVKSYEINALAGISSGGL